MIDTEMSPMCKYVLENIRVRIERQRAIINKLEQQKLAATSEMETFLIMSSNVKAIEYEWNQIKLGKTNTSPKVGEVLKCLVCALDKPWGIFDMATGSAVCIECRDKARA